SEDDAATGAWPAEDGTDFSPNNFSFDFGPAVDVVADITALPELAAAQFEEEVEAGRRHDSRQDADPPSANTADILKFLIDRTGYIKLLEQEDTPEAYSRIENLRELVN